MLGLGQRLPRFGADPEVVIVGEDGPLIDRLRTADLPYRCLGFARGRDVIRHPTRFAQAVGRHGADGALLLECGFLGAALRAGGYRRSIVAVEHGSIFFPSQARIRRIADRISRASGAWADDAEVAVSDFVLQRMYQQPHARRLRRIYNGIDPDAFMPLGAPAQAEQSSGLVAGFVGRLVHGKGLDHLIRGVARAREQVDVSLLVAGNGPERDGLTTLADRIGVSDRVNFLGMVENVPEFWRQCDLAIVPSDTFIESFCVAALEAMACGKPVIATRNGGLPEVVSDKVTGTLVRPGDPSALAEAIITYAQQPALRRTHGDAGRTRSIDEFHLDRCAQAYLDVFATLD